eukprot:403343805
MEGIQKALKMAASLDLLGLDQISAQTQRVIFKQQSQTFNQDVRQLCELKRGPDVFELIKLSIIQTTDQAFHLIASEVEKKNVKDILANVQDFWLKHCLRTLKISEVFQYVQNYMIIQYQKLQSVHQELRMDIDYQNITNQNESTTEDSFDFWNIGIQAIKGHLNPQNSKGLKLLQLIVDDLIYQITLNRQMFIEKKSIDSKKMIPIKDILCMLHSLEFYHQYFESKYIDKTSQFYRNQANQLINKADIKTYIHFVYDIIENESVIVQNFLQPSSLEIVLQALEQTLIKDHSQQILEKGFTTLVHQRNFETLELLFCFYEECKLLNHLKAQWILTIRTEGRDILSHIKIDQKPTIIIAVKKLFELKELTDKILNVCFENRDEFKYAQKEGFESILNIDQQPDKSANQIALFIDKLMQKENVTSSHKSLKKEISGVKHDTIISLFRYLSAKDTFEVFFTKYLCERLIKRKSESWDEEKDFIAKLKNECGNQFTGRVEQMFIDVQNSSQFSKEFLEKKKMKNPLVETEFFVLQSNSWPISVQQHQFNIPKSISESHENFLQFYKKKFNGRTLNWSIDYCSSIVKATYDSQNYQFEASGVQAIVLLNFNNVQRMSYKDIQTKTLIFDDFLKAGLTTLSSKDINILVRESKDLSSQITNDDIFILNEDYNSKLRRININKTIRSQEHVQEEQKETEDRVREDRRFQIDAATTKIMKEHKLLAHNDLMQKLFEYLKFPIDATTLKARIESLIEKDYLKRNATDSSIYEYVA